jgi:hypothetical protein
MDPMVTFIASIGIALFVGIVGLLATDDEDERAKLPRSSLDT